MKKGLLVILGIVVAIAGVSVGMLIYVVNTYYLNRQDITSVDTESYASEEGYDLEEPENKPEVDSVEQSEDVNEEVEESESDTDISDEDYVESAEPEESESSEPLIEHSRIWESLSKNTGDNAIAEMSDEDYWQEWEKAEALLDGDEYRIYFVASHLPDDWELETCDIIRYVNGSKQYWYNVANTDVFFSLTFESDTAQGVPGECWNMYGDAPAIMFNNGVPEHAEDIYNSLVMQGVPSESYTTDYVDGDNTITLSNAWTGIVEFEGLTL